MAEKEKKKKKQKQNWICWVTSSSIPSYFLTMSLLSVFLLLLLHCFSYPNQYEYEYDFLLGSKSSGTSDNNTTYTTNLTTPKNMSNLTNHIMTPKKKKNNNMKKKQNMSSSSSPYHDWQLFASDFTNMMTHFKIFVYPTNNTSNFPLVFLPHPNPFDPKLGNYHSEHMFKISLLRSSFITPHPHLAHFFFLPFSINSLRNDPRVHSQSSISQFVFDYTTNISRIFPFWNASAGSDHFFVSCHSVGRNAVSLHPHLHNNAIHITCSSSYFQRFYITHKDIGFPQIWPRPPHPPPHPPHNRDKLVFFAGRIQNSIIRQQLFSLWGNDSSFHIFSSSPPPFPYEDGFRTSKYCLHLKGYEVNTARLADAIHYGCIPVIISNYYHLPFANVLDWTKFSVIITQSDLSRLKTILLSISTHTYLTMYSNLSLVRQHFVWHTTPTGYDSFHMTAYQLWLRRTTHTHHVSSK